MEYIKVSEYTFCTEKIVRFKELALQAKPPTISVCGKACYPSRRTLNIGTPYYYDTSKNASIAWDNKNEFLKEDFPRVTQCLMNVYEDSKNNIGWHRDKISGLDGGTVVSASFALNEEDNDKVLAVMEFREGTKGKAFASIPLKHGVVVMFDAKKHHEHQIYHRIPKTLAPRLNVTFRQVG